MERSRFEEMVVRAKQYIHDGEAIQIVISQRFDTELISSPFDIYRALRRINPSPYMYYLDFDGDIVIGASPEVLVRQEDGRVALRPIAGTRPRGRNDVEDRRLKEELLADPKERAEHVMLVDLGRNDIEVLSENIAMFEKNIAIALFNKGQYEEAVEHFDKALMSNIVLVYCQLYS